MPVSDVGSRSTRGMAICKLQSQCHGLFVKLARDRRPSKASGAVAALGATGSSMASAGDEARATGDEALPRGNWQLVKFVFHPDSADHDKHLKAISCCFTDRDPQENTSAHSRRCRVPPPAHGGVPLSKWPTANRSRRSARSPEGGSGRGVGSLPSGPVRSSSEQLLASAALSSPRSQHTTTGMEPCAARRQGCE
ncbi:hypothetical protein EYF80_050307 [Liparis tanakae]|uniref:Uncharacterized protein n=1 Tax=Liparis tanakae TaxID=230148 RepID=A0A4Z2FF11_9TELE|nr:hypothetical protein EYF80_050307 [Liparis tanakae]